MAGKFLSLGTLVVIGVIIADIITHGSQTQQAAQGVASIESPALGALLGVAP